MTTTQKPRARLTDPETSHTAAASVRGITDTQALILSALEEHGPLTDEGIAEVLATHHPRRSFSPSGLRTRRKELQRLGRIRAAEQPLSVGTTRSGRPSKLWEVAR